jgi:methanol:N,N-dimethyl-4-nitrosoaniline oxidoreductase
MRLKHLLLVTSGLRGTGIVDEVKRNLEDAGVAVTVYDKVESNPKDYNCMDAYKLFTEQRCDGFISVGGGSSHDAAKGARIVAAHDGRNINEFQGLNKSEKLENPPHIAINTTNGTGSETTPGYVITDLSSPEAPHKWVGFDLAATTSLAINDPLLMMTQPIQFIGFTGFDTLAHASECYVSRVEHLSATPLALRAVTLVAENLREAYANPRNYEAMANMCWAQYTAAQAFSSGFLGILHSLSHAVCAYRGPSPAVHCNGLQAKERPCSQASKRRKQASLPSSTSATAGWRPSCFLPHSSTSRSWSKGRPALARPSLPKYWRGHSTAR